MRITKDDIIDFNMPGDFNMKFIEHEEKFNIYKISYTYKTPRGNKKENHKYLIAPNNTDAKFKFLDYINKTNTEKPYRAISNVQILDVANIGTVAK
ncbi:MAG: hypothetical protein ACRDD7_03715 [Peptostreptococcaceae bacterium]